MPYLMVHQHTDDYDAWRDAFDDSAPARAEAGLGGGYVLRGLEDESLVTMMLEFEYDQLDQVKQFVQKIKGEGVDTFILDDASEIEEEEA
jgi:hypothetical protein